MVLPEGLTEQERESFSSNLTHFALFSEADAQHVRFDQEILEHYLLGQSLISLYDANRESFLRRLDVRVIPADWITLRVTAHHIKEQQTAGGLIPLVYEAAHRPRAFKNVVQLVALATDDPKALREIPLERQDLSGIVLENLDLSQVSLRGVDLTDARFRACQLQGVNLEDAILKGTIFASLQEDALRGGVVGDLARFYLIHLDEKGGRRTIEDHVDARIWFAKMTERQSRTIDPCPTALQLRYLFGKFVRPNGQARQSKMNINGVLAGKRHVNPQEVLEGAIQHGYLVPDSGPRHTIKRPEGNIYSEVVGFMTSMNVTPSLRALLNDVCPVAGCLHVPEATGDASAFAR